MALVNGQIGSGVLVSVGGGQALRADAAAAWLAVVAEVRAQFGITLRLTDSYRPYAVQVRIFNERYDPASSGSGPFGDVRWWNGVRYVRMRGASAAVPGTSNHGWGVAVDVTGLGGFAGSTYARLAAVAPAHGWSNKAGRQINEAWHWEYTPAANTHPTPAPAPTPATPTTVQEDDMGHIVELLYRAYLNREAGVYETLDWVRSASTAGWNAAQTEAKFMTSHAEAGTVIAAFRHFIGHDPNPQQIAVWSDTETIAQVWAGVGGSPEAIARR